MEIVRRREGDVLEVRVSGRLDNYGSEPLDHALAEMIREGGRHLRLDLSNVNYVSSAGIGVLMNAYREVTNLQGTLRIVEASERVRTILSLVALDGLLFGTETEEAAAPPSTDVAQQIPSRTALFEAFVLDGSRSAGRLLGAPEKLARETYGAGDSSSINATKDLYALGVGALGHSFDECQSLFGEFVAAAGNAAYMPSDSTSTPDYMTSSGELVPQLQALYAIAFQGSPSHLLRFESSKSEGGVPLGEIVNVCASVAATPHFGVVIAAEVFGLVCAFLRRSPARSGPAQFDFPAVRDWLSFAPEQEYARNSSLVVGVASSSPTEAMRPFLRPVSDEFQGHFHAVVTAFRSLRQGRVEIAEVVAQAFQPRSVVSVVHLLRDGRAIEGAGQSEFQRGACWVFPLTSLESGVAS